jgi:hypothetical protein
MTAPIFREEHEIFRHSLRDFLEKEAKPHLDCRRYYRGYENDYLPDVGTLKAVIRNQYLGTSDQ